MNRVIASGLLLIATAACGGTDFSTVEGAGGKTSRGSGGATSEGTSSNEGGAVATTTPAEDCTSLLRTYLSALDAARACDPGGGTETCKAEWTLPGPCDCNVLVNAESSAYQLAKTHHDAVVQAGCSIESCPTVDCAGPAGAESTPTCKSSGSGSATTCQW